MKKLMAADYDGTFFREDIEEVKKNVEAVKRWREAGNIFTFATGRDVVNIGFEYDRFGIEYDYLVGVNGAFVCDSDENVLLKMTIDNKIAREIIDILYDDVDGQVLVQNGIDGCYVVYPIEGDEISINLNKKVTKLYKHTAQEALNEEVVSVGCRANDFETAKCLNDIVNEKYADQVDSFNNLTYVNVVSKGISKATGVQLVADKYGVSKENIFVVGDNRNDIELITEFTGTCVDSGVDEAKAAASKIVNSVHEYIEENL